MPKKIDKRTDVGKLILASPMAEQEKSRLLFALPTMSDEEITDLHKELKKVQKKEKERIGTKLEEDLAKEEKVNKGLENLYQEMGTKRESLQHDANAEQVEISNDILQEIGKDPQKLTALLIAMGPKEIKRLEQAVKRLAADPNYHFSKKQIDDTVKKLREFSTDVYQASQEIDENFRKMQLIEQIRLEKEKQKFIQECIDELDKTAPVSQQG